MKQALKTVPRGTIFEYAGQRWVVLEHDSVGQRTLCLTEKIVENYVFDENNNNNWAESSSHKYLNEKFLYHLDEEVDVNTFIETKVDLTSDDGLKDYGTTHATIFLLTADQYRRNRDVIPNENGWWWLSTAFSTASKDHGVQAIAPNGAVRDVDAHSNDLRGK